MNTVSDSLVTHKQFGSGSRIMVALLSHTWLHHLMTDFMQALLICMLDSSILCRLQKQVLVYKLDILEEIF